MTGALIIKWLITHWKALVLVGAIVAAWSWHTAQVRQAYRNGVITEQTKARVEAGKRIIEMEKTNETFRKLPAIERCRAFMRDSGMSEHHCTTDG